MSSTIKFFLTLLICAFFVPIAKGEDESSIQKYRVEIDGEEIVFDNEPKFDKSDSDVSESKDGIEGGDGENIDIDSEESAKEEVAIEYPKRLLSEVNKENFADVVILQGLDKITAKSSYLESQIGQNIEFKRLEIEPIKCWKAPPKQTPENKVLMRVYENTLDGKRKEIFYGWMFSSSPALSTLEHPVYDITVIDCKFSETENSETKNEK